MYQQTKTSLLKKNFPSSCRMVDLTPIWKVCLFMCIFLLILSLSLFSSTSSSHPAPRASIKKIQTQLLETTFSKTTFIPAKHQLMLFGKHPVFTTLSEQSNISEVVPKPCTPLILAQVALRGSQSLLEALPSREDNLEEPISNGADLENFKLIEDMRHVIEASWAQMCAHAIRSKAVSSDTLEWLSAIATILLECTKGRWVDESASQVRCISHIMPLFLKRKFYSPIFFQYIQTIYDTLKLYRAPEYVLTQMKDVIAFASSNQ